MSRAIAKVNDLSWMTGGPQGSGVDSSANIFAGACVLGGLWTFGLREYYSSIKGPHSYFEVRVNSDKIRSHVNNVDVLATFDAETLIRHAEEVVPGGGILEDHGTLGPAGHGAGAGPAALGTIPCSEARAQAQEKR